MFPPIKKVAFQDKLVQIIPSPAVERSSSDTEGEVEEQEAGADGERLSLTEDEHQKRRELIEAEDGHSKPIHGRRKRHREWVWRPVEGDILVYHDIGSREHKLRNEVEEDILELADRRGSPLCLGETLHSG